MNHVDVEPVGLERHTAQQLVQGLFQNSGLHVVNMEPLQQGAFSRGRVVVVQNGGIDTRRLFLKHPTHITGVLTHSHMDELHTNARAIPHGMTTHGVLGMRNDHVLHPLEAGHRVERIYMVLDALPAESIKLTRLLSHYGLDTVQSERTPVVDAVHMAFLLNNMSTIYSNVIDVLATIHEGALPPENERARLYAAGLQNIITDPIRLDGIASIYFGFGQESALNHDAFMMLRKRMVLLAQAKGGEAQRLRTVHGDSWGPNIFVDNHLQTHFIDPAIALSDAGLDVVFATADIAHIAIKEGVPEAPQIFLGFADELVDHYARKTGDVSIRKNMALFYGFKGFVRAVFDAKTEESRMQAFCGALGAVTLALRDPNFEFRFSDLGKYAAVGKQQLH
ncbi:MAG: hypothetical protein WC775_02735 [Patescibacteria group bacterium]|jgi:hypothetical protein